MPHNISNNKGILMTEDAEIPSNQNNTEFCSAVTVIEIGTGTTVFFSNIEPLSKP